LNIVLVTSPLYNVKFSLDILDNCCVILSTIER